MKKAIYAGSFDPPTLAHFNVFRQAKDVFSSVTVVAGENAMKRGSIFTPVMRHEAWTKEMGSDLDGFSTMSDKTSVIASANFYGASHIVRGIRGPQDMELEHAFYDFVTRNSALKIVYFTVPAYLRTCSSTSIRALVGLTDWKDFAVKYTTDHVVSLIEKVLQNQRPAGIRA